LALRDERDAQSGAALPPGAVTALIERLAARPVDGAHALLGPGSRIGRYELIRGIGHGGFGEVWEAHDTVLHRLVALKVLHPPSAASLGDASEGEAAARLAHPAIAALHDAGVTEAGAPWLVYELLHGETLESRLGRGPLPAPEALRIAGRIAAALAHAHDAGVVHRDLKPANVFLTADGEVKVLDFGVALVFGRPAPSAGTPGYMAPEQRRGEPEDARTDLYALGLLLREMLTGERAAVDVETDRRVPHAARRVLTALLQPDPAVRPRSARAAEGALAAAARAARGPRGGRWLRLGLWLGLAAAVAAALAAGLAARERDRAPAADTATATATAPPSIAVMPFADLSPEKDQEYFSDGLAEEILNALAQLDGLRVAGRTSAFFFKGKNEDVATIGEKLNVSTLLEGSVRKAGNRVRITAQLVSTSDGFRVWSQTYDRELTDVFAVQDEIARAVAANLRVKLLSGAEPTTKAYRTANPEVYEQYLIGREVLGGASPELLRKAIAAYERALELEPGYAPAWAGLAVATYWYGNTLDRRADVDAQKRKAHAAADRAIALDPQLADGYTARALVASTFSERRADLAADLERALALNPGRAETHLAIAVWVLEPEGRHDEAVAALRRATQIDPLFAGPWTVLGSVLLHRGELAEARAVLTRAMELAPQSDFPPHFLVLTALLEGRPAEALPLLERPSTLFREIDAALLQRALGREDEARRTLERVIAQYGEVAGFQIAEVLAWWGEKERALEWLERAYAQRDDGIIDLATSPFLVSVRGDPRYVALARKLDLPLP
jgi:TolB-like protein/Tfp pilus assembly protein PilF